MGRHNCLIFCTVTLCSEIHAFNDPLICKNVKGKAKCGPEETGGPVFPSSGLGLGEVCLCIKAPFLFEISSSYRRGFPSLGAPAWVLQGTVPSWQVTGKSHVALAHGDLLSWGMGEVGGLECYTTWLELWVFLCFRVQREGPRLSLHQFKETCSCHRRLGKGHVSPLMMAWGGVELRV